MKIKIELDQKAMSKSRKFVYLEKEGTKDINSTRYTTNQAHVICNALTEMGIDIKNNTGLTF